MILFSLGQRKMFLGIICTYFKTQFIDQHNLEVNTETGAFLSWESWLGYTTAEGSV